MTASQQAHRDFLNRYYGAFRHVYDLSRKYYLFGRDRALRELLEEPWESLVEVGPGTGRNLIKLRRGRRHASYGGVEASDAMLELARRRCPWANLVHGFAEDCDYAAVHGEPPDRILFSYCLSMVQEPTRALENAQRSLAPGGEVLVVDFADLGGVPTPFRGLLSRWLATFHVEPLDLGLLHDHDAAVRFGPGRYYLIARLSPRP
ncbi:MAG: class I SAM-dependent methyltransferase [Sandaracinaceae bacterium]